VPEQEIEPLNEPTLHAQCTRAWPPDALPAELFSAAVTSSLSSQPTDVTSPFPELHPRGLTRTAAHIKALRHHRLDNKATAMMDSGRDRVSAKSHASSRAAAWHAGPRTPKVHVRVQPIIPWAEGTRHRSVRATRAAALEYSDLRWPRAQSAARALVCPSPSRPAAGSRARKAHDLCSFIQFRAEADQPFVGGRADPSARCVKSRVMSTIRIDDVRQRYDARGATPTARLCAS
jgi:hypothetical protein